MLRVEKTVFISYRRADLPLALLVFKDLTQHGYDVFIDYDGIASGDFERVILDNIRARAHFLVVLTPSALERCSEPGDWLRREIEAAIEARRNIVPLMLPGFDFSSAVVTSKLTGALLALNKYNGLPVPYAYFDEAMERLRRRHLNVPLEAVLHPASPAAIQAAKTQQEAAAAAPPAQLDEAVAVSKQVGPRLSLRRLSNAQRIAAAAAGVGVILVGMAVFEPGRREQPQIAATNLQAQSPSKSAAVASDAASTQADLPKDAAKQKSLGDDYYFGRSGVRQSHAEAAKWYRKAAEQGDVTSQFNLGAMYQQGLGGLPKSDTEAVKWYLKAAEQGDASAQVNLALMYVQGLGGLPRSDTEALKLYRKAADQGYAPALDVIGSLYENGIGGLPRSDSEAVKWYRKAAEKGYASGQFSLGTMYERGGGGLPQSKTQAIELYRKAAKQGYDDAKQALKRLGEQ